jgi:hypothetical protein
MLKFTLLPSSPPSLHPELLYDAATHIFSLFATGTFLTGNSDPEGVLAWLEERIAAGTNSMQRAKKGCSMPVQFFLVPAGNSLK